jgi:glycosyltransferase involved in cell wall biosynthesis
MRLLMLTPEFERGGGIATFYRHLAPALARGGADVRVIEGSAFHAGSRDRRTVEGVDVETLELERLHAWGERLSGSAAAPGLRRHLAAAWAMWEQADEAAWADVVEAADWGMAFVPPAIEGARPLVVQGHGSIGQISVHDAMAGEEVQGALIRLIESAILSRAQGMQTYSQANADFWRLETGRPVQMIRPAVRLSPDRSAGEVSDRGLVAGRIQRWKGPEVLCQALALMGPSTPAIDWLGKDTSYGRRNSSTASEMARLYAGVWPRLIRCMPPAPAEEVAERQSRARFNLIPSDWDVFNFTVVEAMASGRPTVVSTGAGAGEMVADGQTGFLFEAGNPTSLAAALDRVMSASPDDLADMGRAARDTVRRELDPDIIAAARLAAYRKAIADFEQASPGAIRGWIGEICRSGAASDPEAFLAQFPIRALGRHMAARLSKKVAQSARRRQP